jgi:thiol-disulfide isomerase/thioredoxin
MMFRPTALVLGALLALGACADPELSDKVEQLDAKITDLEKKVEAGGGAPAPRRGPAGADPALEEGAKQAVSQISAKVDELAWDEAMKLCNDARSQFGATQTFRRGGRICDEAEVVGKDALDLDVEKWFQGEAHLADSKATMLVFWEQWCPHCKREVPKMQETYDKYQGRMNVVGLTKVTRSSTDDSVAEFIKEKEISYPMGKEKGGNLSQHYNVSGVPAAAIVKDGKIVWRGHPARVDDALLDKLL